MARAAASASAHRAVRTSGPWRVVASCRSTCVALEGGIARAGGAWGCAMVTPPGPCRVDSRQRTRADGTAPGPAVRGGGGYGADPPAGWRRRALRSLRPARRTQRARGGTAPWRPAPSCARSRRGSHRASTGRAAAARPCSAPPECLRAAAARRPRRRHRPASRPSRAARSAAAALHRAAAAAATAPRRSVGRPRATAPTVRAAVPCRSARPRKRARCRSMNSLTTCSGGRAAPGRRTRWPASGSRWHGAARAPRAPAP